MKTKPTYYRKSAAIKELEELATSKAKEKFPTIPAEWLAPRTFKDNSANSLTKSIIEWIRLNGGQAERISSMGRVVNNSKKFTDVLGRTRQVGGSRYIPGNGTKGTADISATIKGRSVKIEVKFGNDRQSESQKKYQADVEASGGIYYIARTFESFLTWYKEIFFALLILLSGCKLPV